MARRKGHSTIAIAKRAYAAKVPVMPANYVAGVSRFLGTQVSASSVPVQKYTANIGPASADKWERNLRAAFTG